jgi:hypothetical protein
MEHGLRSGGGALQGVEHGLRSGGSALQGMDHGLRSGGGALQRVEHGLRSGGAVPSATCGVVPFDVLRSVGAPSDTATWNLAHSGVDLFTGLTCDQISLGRVYEGYFITAPARTLTLVHGGRRLQFQLGAPAAHFSRNDVVVSLDIYQRVPYGGSLFSGNLVLGATGRPAAFYLDDGRLWPVSCLEAITANNSSITMIPTNQWDTYPVTPALFCLR